MRRTARAALFVTILLSFAVAGVYESNFRDAPVLHTPTALVSPNDAPTPTTAAPTASPVPTAHPRTPPLATLPPATPAPTPSLAPPSRFPPGVAPGPLAFHDEFDGPSLDTARWAYPTDGAGLGGKQHWDRSACRVTDGALHITGGGHGGSYTSCAIWTQGRQAIGPYGYWEMRARIPATAGTWPAFWSVAYDRLADPSLAVWELDVMEAISHVTTNANIVSWNLHARTASGTTADFEHFGNPYGLGAALYVPQWHTYAMDWRADHIAWYVDGVEQFRVTEGEVIGGMTVRIPAMRQVLIVQMGIGGAEGVDESGLPATMEVDYVRVYS